MASPVSPQYANAALGRKDAAAFLRSPRQVRVTDAIQKNMRVPKPAGASVPWDPNLTGYMVEPINALKSREYDVVVFVGPARTGKTIGLVDGFIVYVITCDPSDTLLVHLTEAKAREHSRKRLDPTFRRSPEVLKCLSPSRHDNNVHDKVFKSGMYLKIAWPTPNSLASSDYKYVLLTDYDRWPADIGGEGSGFVQASKRTTTYMSAGMTAVESSPGFDVIDPRWKPAPGSHEAPPCDGIMMLYNQGDRRRLYWPCPNAECGEYFQPVLENMTWPDLDTQPDAVKASEAARVVCPHCGRVIDPDEKRQLNHPDACVWLREGETITKEGVRGGQPRRSRYATFWMEGPAAAYQTWEKLVFQLIEAEREYEATGSQETLKARINTDWGRPYVNRIGKQAFDAEELMDRAEPLPKREVPMWVRFLVAAVDVQAGRNRRFVVQIVGYGERGERVLIDRYNLRFSNRADEETGEVKKIDPAGYLEDWDLIETDVMDKAYYLADDSGRRMPVMVTACDHGGEDGVSDHAYKFWRKMRRKGRGKQLMLVKGATAPTKLVRQSFPDNRDDSRRRADARGDVPLYLLHTDELKDRVHNGLTRVDPGPNAIHHPDWLGAWFYSELTAEAKGKDGKWRKVSEKAPNEAFDLYAYAHAAVVFKGYDAINWAAPPPWAKPIEDNPNILALDQPVKAYAEPKRSTPPPSPAESVPTPDDDQRGGDDSYLGGINHEGWLR